MADIKERYGTEAQKAGDKEVVKSLWKWSPTSYDNEKIVELPYADYGAGTIALGALTAYQQYKINSVFDPDLTGSGNQPLGRDTWAGIYNFYKVLETHVKVSVTDLTDNSTGVATNAVYPSLHGWMADLTANPPASINSWLMASMASNGNKQQIFSSIKEVDVINGRGKKEVIHEYHWDASQFDTSVIDNTKNEWTPVGSDPANINYFSLIMYNPQNPGSRTVVYHTEIRYLVAFKQINRTLLNTVN